MNKVLHVLAWGVLSLYGAFAQGFTTNNTNGNLLDANGNNFIMKGMNVPLAWYVNDVNGSISAVRSNTNSNCLRIVVQTSTSDAAWQTCVQNCINNKMIPMVELHDVTGSTNQADLVRMGQFWASKASYLTRPEIAKYILINIANEWGTWQTANTNGAAWRDASTNAIKAMRDAGIKTTIVVDAVGYGQDIDDAKNIRAYAKTIQASDAGFLGGQANLLFSIHMYCEWRKGGDNIGIVNTIKNSGVPIIVGEFGYQHATDGSCDIDEQAILNTCQAGGVGWLAWSQKGNGGGVEYLDLCNNWSCSSLSDWGNTIVNGSNGTKTAVTATVFETVVSPTPTVSITAPANNGTFCAAAPLTIAATASVSSGSISKVEFYDGNILLGTDNSAPFSYVWESPTSGAHTIRAIATSVANIASVASTVNVTFNAAPAAPSVKTPVVYNVNDPEVALTATGTGLKWYTQASGGNALSSAPVPTTATAGNTVYYVSQMGSNNCESPRASIQVVVGNIYKIYKVNTAPTIDGGIDAIWENASTAPATLAHVTVGAVNNASDLSGSFKALWDNTYIYVLGQITDDIKSNDSPEVYNDDAIELYLDINNDKANTYGANDVQYNFGWNDGTTVTASPAGMSTANVSYAMRATNTGYIFEARIPWGNLQASPALNQLLGLEFEVNDDDNGSTRDGKLAWHATADNAWENPSAFGTAMLASEVVTSLASEEIDLNTALYPNPFQETTILKVHGHFEYEVYDVSGAKVDQGVALDQVFLGAHLKAGVYAVHILQNQTVKHVRVSKF